jgi:hypothetical protein
VAAAESLLRFTTRFEFTEIGGVFTYQKINGSAQSLMKGETELLMPPNRTESTGC